MPVRKSHKLGSLMVTSALAAAALCALPAAGALAVDTPTTFSSAPTQVAATPSDTLAATPWETTGAVNQNGDEVALTDPAVSNFVGWAYYKTDGTFKMYNLDDTPKMQGDWTVSADGASRTLVAKDANGNVLFTRVVPITVLTDAEFTYRIIPDAANPDVYYDIIHTPTTHTEPGTVSPSAVLASTPWQTTGAVNQNGDEVALTDPAVANFVGWAYYKTDGTFTMYNLDDTPKMRGDWVVSPDGTTRTLVAKDAEGNVLFTRVVPITVLTNEEFTYRITPDAANPDVYYDIVHTPTTHVEPQIVEPPTPKPVYEARKTPVFGDTPVSHKFYKEIDWMNFTGYSTGWRQPAGKPLYKPQDKLSREAMAAFIFRMEADKSYRAPKVSPFADVTTKDTFYKEIAWMWEQKLSTGYRQSSGKPEFHPKEELSREAMAAFIYRLESPKDFTAPATSPLADMKQGMPFYKEISWMYAEGLTTGNKVGSTKEFWPKDKLSREAMAAFIFRLANDYRTP
ncbi:DUF4822 domain-containing protein [Leucobacter coleopterorum]|uniref:DUF4822 domain-containing protein n=1 Tax=Leucobacter coleopterorum TaxID=2714933 RepID=A0ABX6JY52_9MICO|nr:DUF4822 domain-containing protein [Leucobacter coleopterorum]QIM17774.1 DUF4822 domain-containing protein [Leucobacter coleopterorum]